MNELRVPITARGLKYGYLTWPKAMQTQVQQFLKNQGRVSVRFLKDDLGPRRVDWKYCRMSLGVRSSERVPANASEYSLKCAPDGGLEVELG